jgi:hypothetical protein
MPEEENVQNEVLEAKRKQLADKMTHPEQTSAEDVTRLVDEINQIPHGAQNPQVAGHFRDYSQKLNAESERIRRDYPMHHGEAGRSREEEVREFFALHLPSAFEVKEGFVIDSKGGISKQSDLLIIDALWNKPIGSGPNPFWLRESVYASVEIKTTLDPDDPRSANFMNYMNGVDFGTSIWSTQLHVKG